MKTGAFKEQAPYDPDWYFVRCASVARHIYLKGGLGVGAMKKMYGGSQRRGVRPNKFAKGAGGLIRSCLQQLEKLNIVEQDENGGRRITSKGQRDLDRIAGRCVAAAEEDNDEDDEEDESEEEEDDE